MNQYSNLDGMTRGSASSVLSATTSRAVTPFLPFKTIALCDAYDFYIQKGSPVIKVVKILSQTSNPITAKISTAIGGKGRTFNSFPKKGDTMYAVQAMGDDMPIIFAYANGYNGNLNNPTPVDDEKFISLSGSYFWYKKSGSYNINVKLNYVAEIGKDYALKAKKSVSIETLDMSISCQSYAVTSSARINIITKAMYAKAENIKIKANATAIIESPKICLGSQSADQPAVLGKRLLDWINTHTHTGNLGYPTTPPLTPLPASVLSTIVKLK